MDAGNTYLAQLSAATQWILHVDLTTFSGDYGYAVYPSFNVGGHTTNYTLTSLGTYTGTAGKSLSTSVYAGLVLCGGQCLVKKLTTVRSGQC